MGLFDAFKKKKPEPDYDPTNLRLQDLRRGFVVEYDLKNWQVSGEYEYDWGNNFFTREFQLDSGDDRCYLHVEEDDELVLTVSRKIGVRALGQDIPEYARKHEHPPERLVYEGVTYFLDEENYGYYRDTAAAGDNWSELVSWSYYDESEKRTLTIEQWGDRDFEASVGEVVPPYAFSNLLPGER
ncbi:MAG: DUF4178 domain-containing protein [Catalinimonas sp.]